MATIRRNQPRRRVHLPQGPHVTLLQRERRRRGRRWCDPGSRRQVAIPPRPMSHVSVYDGDCGDGVAERTSDVYLHVAGLFGTARVSEFDGGAGEAGRGDIEDGRLRGESQHFYYEAGGDGVGGREGSWG